MKENSAHIDLLIAACKKISEYIAGLDETAFDQGSMVQSAVIMQLQVIGETAKKVDDDAKAQIDAPWKMIVGLRNVIAHNYFMLDMATIWKIATMHIPDLESKLHAYLEAHGTSYLPPFDDTTPLLD